MREHLARLTKELGVSVSMPEVDGSRNEAVVGAEQARQLAQEETRVDLSTSRVRVGFTRGHLLEVVVQVPLDVEGDEESLQVAAEIVLEESVGASLLDTWVASVSVDRIARTRGLVMATDDKSEDSPHAIDEARDLIERGVSGVRAELPLTLLGAAQEREDWTALDIPTGTSGLQVDRRYASTWHPEALKCALEGMPFSSSRFTQGDEVFAWLRWESALLAEERVAFRERAEEFISTKGASVLALCGTGFGARSDYIDLWFDLSEPRLALVLQEFRQLIGPVELGFYDGAFGDLSFVIP